uniref:Uncharacterized protein n=1 Tax=Sphaerodactylus townsendi TaxID=933632 RepID=A0ACB8F2W8_9SAUR
MPTRFVRTSGRFFRTPGKFFRTPGKFVRTPGSLGKTPAQGSGTHACSVRCSPSRCGFSSPRAAVPCIHQLAAGLHFTSALLPAGRAHRSPSCRVPVPPGWYLFTSASLQRRSRAGDRSPSARPGPSTAAWHSFTTCAGSRAGDRSAARSSQLAFHFREEHGLFMHSPSRRHFTRRVGVGGDAPSCRPAELALFTSQVGAGHDLASGGRQGRSRRAPLHPPCAGAGRGDSPRSRARPEPGTPPLPASRYGITGPRSRIGHVIDPTQKILEMKQHHDSIIKGK